MNRLISGEGKTRLELRLNSPEAHSLGSPNAPITVRFIVPYRRGHGGLFNPGEVATLTAGEAGVLVSAGHAELVE